MNPAVVFLSTYMTTVQQHAFVRQNYKRSKPCNAVKMNFSQAFLSDLYYTLILGVQW